MKKIVLITGSSQPKVEARVTALYADQPEDRRVVRTHVDLARALAAGHTALIKTDKHMVRIRQGNLERDYPNVPIEVEDTDA